jgi:hypothetical protein
MELTAVTMVQGIYEWCTNEFVFNGYAHGTPLTDDAFRLRASNMTEESGHQPDGMSYLAVLLSPTLIADSAFRAASETAG